MKKILIPLIGLIIALSALLYAYVYHVSSRSEGPGQQHPNKQQELFYTSVEKLIDANFAAYLDGLSDEQKETPDKWDFSYSPQTASELNFYQARPDFMLSLKNLSNASPIFTGAFKWQGARLEPLAKNTEENDLVFLIPEIDPELCFGPVQKFDDQSSLLEWPSQDDTKRELTPNPVRGCLTHNNTLYYFRVLKTF